MKQATCEERIDRELHSTLATLRHLWNVYKGQEDPDDETNEDSLYEYGLSFDYVPPGTSADQDEGYWCYQLSWGGPSDEFRFYASPTAHGFAPYRIEYVFLDWFDGATRELRGEDKAFLIELWGWFNEGGLVEHALEESRELTSR